MGVFFGEIPMEFLSRLTEELIDSFLNQIIFLLLSYMISLLYILDINPLANIWLTDIFSHFVGCLFVLLRVSFAAQKPFSLM